MADVIMIVPRDWAEAFRLAGARVWPAEDAVEAQNLTRHALHDADAGIVGLAEPYFTALDPTTLRAIERHYRPVVVPVPTETHETPQQRHRAYLQELVRRAVGITVTLGEADSTNGAKR